MATTYDIFKLTASNAMLATSQHEMEEAIEAMIDESGAAYVLNAIMAVCYGKAEHLETNWQDSRSARQWRAIGRKAELAASKASEYSC